MKIALIGNSHLALSVAWGISQNELAQQIVVFTGSEPGIKQVNRSTSNRKAIADAIEDLTIAAAVSPSDTAISFANASEKLSDTQVVVLLPVPLPFGLHAAHALKTSNLSLIRQIIPKILEDIQNTTILIAMPFANHIAAWIHQTHGLKNIIGIANGVSTAHLKAEITNRLGLSVNDISALAIGNDDVTHPLPQYCRVNGIPLSLLMSDPDIQELTDVVSKRCPYTSASEYTLASHILQVLTTISLDKKRVMSAGTLITTDTTSVFLNVPSKIGSNGIESIIPLDLTAPQREQFKQLVAQSASSQNFS